MSLRGQDSRDVILELPSFDHTAYETIDLNRLTVYSISRLREKDVPTSIENIAVANHRFFPRRFAMVGFPEFPDVSRVNRSLLQLRPKYRNWASGNTRSGWMLTAAGEAEAAAVANILHRRSSESLELPRSEIRPVSDAAASRSVDFASEIRRLRSTQLFAKAQVGWRDVANLEVYDVLNAYTHTPSIALARRLRELRQIALDADDIELVSFLDQVRIRFGSLFTRR